MSVCLTAEQEAQAQELAALIRKATDEDLLAVARRLVATEEKTTFGQTEFDVRALLLQAGAKAYETFLAQKKTAIAGRV